MMMPGFAPAAFAIMFVMGTSPTGVKAVNESSSTLQPAALSWLAIQARDSPSSFDPGGRGPKATRRFKSSKARPPLKAGRLSGRRAAAAGFEPVLPGPADKLASEIKTETPAARSVAD